MFDFTYLLFLAPGLLLSLWATSRVKSTFRQYQSIGVQSRMTGAQAAAAVCRAGGANVSIERVGGFLTDHYDPRTKTLRLSPDVYDGRTISSIAVGAHEAGHAIQDATDYAWLRMRSAIVPAVQFGSKTYIWPIVLGVGLQGSIGNTLILVGIGLLAVTVFFQLVTLPVEFDASNRAKKVLEQTGIASTDAERHGVDKVLDAAALTYVASAVSSLATLAYFVLMFLRRIQGSRGER